METQQEASARMYNSRAPKYDESFHPNFAGKMAKLANPQPGQKVLDLACGTGLCTIPELLAVGPSGYVLGVDLSEGMLGEAKEKVKQLRRSTESIGNIELVLHDITKIDELPQLKGQEGMFDVLTVISALVLLDDPEEAIKKWVRYLKPGSGRLVIDATHFHNQRPGIIMEMVLRACQLSVPFNRSWANSDDAFKKLLEGLSSPSGNRLLEVEQYSLQAVTGDGTRYFGVEEGPGLFDHMLKSNPAFSNLDALDDAYKDKLRNEFLTRWKDAADEKGIEDIDGVWVAVAGRTAAPFD